MIVYNCISSCQQLVILHNEIFFIEQNNKVNKKVDASVDCLTFIAQKCKKAYFNAGIEAVLFV